jgi:hypothetical protein
MGNHPKSNVRLTSGQVPASPQLKPNQPCRTPQVGRRRPVLGALHPALHSQSRAAIREKNRFFPKFHEIPSETPVSALSRNPGGGEQKLPSLPLKFAKSRFPHPPTPMESPTETSQPRPHKQLGTPSTSNPPPIPKASLDAGTPACGKPLHLMTIALRQGSQLFLAVPVSVSGKTAPANSELPGFSCPPRNDAPLAIAGPAPPDSPPPG